MLNLLTSFSFLLPIVYSYYRVCPMFILGSILCLISSLFYHGGKIIISNHNIISIIRYIDIAIVNFCIIYFTLLCAYIHKLLIYVIIAIIYCFTIYVFNKSSELLHSSIHIVSNIGICFLIEICYNVEECDTCKSI